MTWRAPAGAVWHRGGVATSGSSVPGLAAALSVGITVDDPVLTDAVRGVLDDVERGLREAVDAADPVLAEASRHLVAAGGKRFRPLLVALAAQFGSSGPAVCRAAVVVELTHLATLYHDDVMDEASVRRGAASANARWGNSIAILTGDYLFARAADLATDLGLDAVRIQARTFARLVHGQIAETVGPRDADPVEHYLRVIADKTGSLIGTSARFGAMFSGAPESVVEAVAAYGDTIGVAFQLSDDVLDIASASAESGKTPGTDLREGVPTLPVLYALADDTADTSAVRLREILAGGAVPDELLDETIELLRESAALKRARETVRGYAERARAQVAGLPDGPARRALESLADFISDRSA
jgi:heptaprenyl diphosphate synthase